MRKFIFILYLLAFTLIFNAKIKCTSDCNFCKCLLATSELNFHICEEEIHTKICIPIENENLELAKQNILEFLPKELQKKLLKIEKEIKTKDQQITNLKSTKKPLKQQLQNIHTTLKNTLEPILILASTMAGPLILLTCMYCFYSTIVPMILKKGLIKGIKLATLSTLGLAVCLNFILPKANLNKESFIPLILIMVTYKSWKNL
jgi:predicted Co/Zn/Cd cation transporter (cation efflux family)